MQTSLVKPGRPTRADVDTHAYACAYVIKCCLRERERERETQTHRDRERAPPRNTTEVIRIMKCDMLL